MADLDLVNAYDIELAGPYVISKAAMNVAVAKFAAVGRAEGILFFSISPGLVETGHHAEGKYIYRSTQYLFIMLTFRSDRGAAAARGRNG